jgi:DNA topoisomerase III
LGFVVEQFLKVSRFSPEPFWFLDLKVAKNGESNKFTWKRGHLFDRLITLILYERSLMSSEGQAKIVKVDEKATSKYRPLPLRTVEFQKAASRFLKISSDQVMTIAEKLYNRGLISYPRTETDIFEFGSEQLRSLIQKQTVDAAFGQYSRDLLDSDCFRLPRKGKNNDKAHPPIHPTSSGVDLAGQERAVFEFVCRRFLACCSEDARGMETKILAQVGIEEFECKGIRVTELNYLLVYKYEKWAEQEIAPFRQGEVLPIEEYLMKDGKTSAPLLLSESDLITCMDKNGIGTDATIHEHIKKILARNYAIKGRDSRFVPTRLGVALVEAFDRLGLDLSLTQPKIRAKLERDLSEICAGQLTKERVIHESKEMYKKVYRKVEAEFDSLLRVFNKYIGRGGSSSDGGGDGGNDDNDGNLPPGNPYDPMPIPRHYNNNNNDDDGGDDENSALPIPPDSKRKRAAPKPRNTANKRSENSSTTKSKRARSNEKSETTEAPNCLCSIEAVRRTVNKDGPNKGKQFWACRKDFNASDNCKFFEWTLEVSSTHKKTNKSFSNHKNGNDNDNGDEDDDGEMRCKCGLIMKKDTMKTGKDAGRQFVKCPKIVQKCGMFLFLESSRDGTEWGNADANTSKFKKAKCFKCNKTGHWANACPN